MRITHRILSVKSILEKAKNASALIVAIVNPARFEARIHELGFTYPLQLGETMLPPDCGTSCAINANGWKEKHRDRQMETFHRLRLVRWKMRRGYGFEHAQGWRNVRYRRRPFTIHPPLEMHLQVRQREDDSVALVMPPVSTQKSDHAKLKIAINAMIEIFGECMILSESLIPLSSRAKFLNWVLLERSNPHWQVVVEAVTEIISAESKELRDLTLYRLNVLNSLKPGFYSIGKGGFAGYVVFGFPEKKLILMESYKTRNATYALQNDWDSLSALSKSALLERKLHLFRVEHLAGWEKTLREKFDQLAEN